MPTVIELRKSLKSKKLSTRGTKKELNKKLNEVVEFSELSMDDLKRQVKTYSTGMIARLSFSIAVSETPDILLIDEVLAVGDKGFQEKCMNRIEEIKKSGTTILFVSHSLGDVLKICDKGICIEDGIITKTGLIEEVGAYYNTIFS